MAGLLVVPVDQISELYPHIISAINMKKDTFNAFVERRHDWRICGKEVGGIFDLICNVVGAASE